MDLGPVVVIVPAVVTSLFAYILTVRRLSGRIATTDSDKLWAEAGHMRAEYRALNKEMAERIKLLVEQNTQQQIAMAELRDDFEACQERLHRLENGGMNGRRS